MDFLNYNDFIIPTDADILRLVQHSPELLQDNFYIKRRYSQIIHILNNLTIRNDNIYIYDMCKGEPVFSASCGPVTIT